MSYPVLVVDDDEAVRVMLARLLESRGYPTSRARDAAEARRLLADGDFALAIMDIVMPGESGLELAGFARQSWPAMPIILISGYSSDDSLALCAVDSKVRFVPKPFGADEFLDLVREAVDSCAVTE